MRFRRWLLALAVVFIVGAAGLATGLTILWWQREQPVRLPEPTGRYAIGRADVDWRDSARIDPFAPAAGTKRELTVWIWYPATTRSGNGAAEYFPSPLRNALTARTGPVLRLLTHDLTRIENHAIRNATVARDGAPYPVVLFKPGLGALALDYTSLAEDLASHGFVVVASDSPYSTAVVVYRDGRIVRRTPAGHPADEGMPTPSREAIENVLRVWVDDNRFILGQLQRLNAEDGGMFSHRLDLNSVGAFGHSFGGATALQFCYEEQRCRAAIDIDGIPFGDVSRSERLSKPFLFFLSDHRADPPAEVGSVTADIDAMRKRLPNHPNEVVLLGSRHFNLSDQALTKNTAVAKAVGMLGPIDERRALAATSDFVRSFFDHWLKDDRTDIRALKAKYPDVRFTP
jgi:predicted dienelactone hydrolase